jgi:hypothetical protein
MKKWAMGNHHPSSSYERTTYYYYYPLLAHMEHAPGSGQTKGGGGQVSGTVWW